MRVEKPVRMSHVDEAPTVELRELLGRFDPSEPSHVAALNQALDSIDAVFDHVAGQRKLLKARSEWLAAERRLPRWWRAVEVAERLLTKSADVARQRRMAAVVDRREEES